MIRWSWILVPRREWILVELNNDQMELILVTNDVELNNDQMELILVPNVVERVDIGIKGCRIMIRWS